MEGSVGQRNMEPRGVRMGWLCITVLCSGAGEWGCWGGQRWVWGLPLSVGLEGGGGRGDVKAAGAMPRCLPGGPFAAGRDACLAVLRGARLRPPALLLALGLAHVRWEDWGFLGSPSTELCCKPTSWAPLLLPSPLLAKQQGPSLTAQPL